VIHLDKLALELWEGINKDRKEMREGTPKAGESENEGQATRRLCRKEKPAPRRQLCPRRGLERGSCRRQRKALNAKLRSLNFIL